MSLEKRVSFAARYVLEARNGTPISVDSVLVYHKSVHTHTIRTKSFVITPTQVYSVKASFERDSNEFRRVEINLEVPRGRRDFDVEVVTNQRGKTFIVPRLGDMQLPAILAERDDTMPPEDICSQLKDVVIRGEFGWQDSPISQLALSDSEIEVVQIYVRVMRFETLFRNCLLSAMSETYGGNMTNRICTILAGELGRIRDRICAIAERYAQESPMISDSQMFEFLGFEHYLILVNDDNLWEKCLKPIFKDRTQTIEGLKVVRDVRNEVAHFRQSVHSRLWAASSMYMDILEGRIKMTDPGFKRLVDMV